MTTFKEARAEMTTALAEMAALEALKNDDTAFSEAYDAARKRAIEAARSYASGSAFGDASI